MSRIERLSTELNLAPDLVIIDRDKLEGPHCYGLPFEQFLELADGLGENTKIRVLTNREQSMVEFIARDNELASGMDPDNMSPVEIQVAHFTDGQIDMFQKNPNDYVFNSHEVDNVGYAAQLFIIADPHSLDVRNDVLIYVSWDFLPHRKAKELCKKKLTNSRGRVVLDPQRGGSSKI